MPRKKQYTPRDAKKLLQSCSFPNDIRARFDQPNAGLRRDKRARELLAVRGEAEVVREDSQNRSFNETTWSVFFAERQT
jgi:hypothetical protein